MGKICRRTAWSPKALWIATPAGAVATVAPCCWRNARRDETQAAIRNTTASMVKQAGLLLKAASIRNPNRVRPSLSMVMPRPGLSCFRLRNITPVQPLNRPITASQRFSTSLHRVWRPSVTISFSIKTSQRKRPPSASPPFDIPKATTCSAGTVPSTRQKTLCLHRVRWNMSRSIGSTQKLCWCSGLFQTPTADVTIPSSPERTTLESKRWHQTICSYCRQKHNARTIIAGAGTARPTDAWPNSNPVNLQFTNCLFRCHRRPWGWWEMVMWTRPCWCHRINMWPPIVWKTAKK